EVEVEVVPGQDAGDLIPDVTHAEDGDARRCGEGLEEDGDLPATALDAVTGDDVLAESGGEGLGKAGPCSQHRPRPLDGRRLQRTATDGVPLLRRRDDHLRAGVTRGVVLAPR